MSEVTPLRVSGTSALAAQADDETKALRTEANGLLEYAKGIRVIDADSYRAAGHFFADIKAKIKEVEAARVKRVKPLNDTVKLINEDYKALTAQLEAVLKVVEAPMLAFQREEDRKRREAEEAARKEAEARAAEARAKAEEELRRQEAERKAAEEAHQKAETAQSPVAAFLAQEEAARAEAGAQAALKAAEDNLRLAAMAGQSVAAALPPKVTAAGTSLRRTWKARVVDATAIPREFLIPNEQLLGQIAREQKENASVPGVEFYAVDSIGGR